MDDGRGAFQPLSAEEEKAMREEQMAALRKAYGSDFQPSAVPRDLPRVFSVGQLVELNGSRFKVAKIAKRRLILKLLPDEAPPEQEADHAVPNPKKENDHDASARSE